MKGFSNRTLSALLFSIVFFAGMAGCTKVNDQLGLGFIPEDQMMTIRQEVFGTEAGQQVRTLTSLPDSLATSGLGSVMFGQSASDTFGKTRAAAIVQMLPFQGWTSYGFSKTVGASKPDSVKIDITPFFISGNKDTENTFNIYNLVPPAGQDTLKVDSTYYQFFDHEAVKGEPLFSFKLQGEYTARQVVKAEILPAGEQFITNLLADTTYYFENWSKFRKDLSKGFVIEAAETSPEDGAVYSSILRYSSDYSMYFYLYFSIPEDEFEERRDEEDEDENVYLVPFFMYDTEDVYESTNLSITSLRHDYTGTPVEQALTQTENEQAQAIAYVHGAGGVTTMLEFPDEFFKAIVDKKENGKYDMMINQALVYVQLENDDTDVMDTSHAKLGSYYNFCKQLTIPDYSLADEYYAAQGTSGYYSYYNGTLNRTHGFYNMDVTTFMHYAIKEYEKKMAGGKVGTDYYPEYMKCYLGPTSSYIYEVQKYEDYAETVIKGTGSDKPVEVRLTYTLIRTGSGE